MCNLGYSVSCRGWRLPHFTAPLQAWSRPQPPPTGPWAGPGASLCPAGTPGDTVGTPGDAAVAAGLRHSSDADALVVHRLHRGALLQLGLCPAFSSCFQCRCRAPSPALLPRPSLSRDFPAGTQGQLWELQLRPRNHSPELLCPSAPSWA